MFIGRTDAEAETPILGPPDAKNWLTWKDPDAGKNWRWEKKGTRMRRGWGGWMASLTQQRWVWVKSGVGDGQGGLGCCSPWGYKELHRTEQLNWTKLYIYSVYILTDNMQYCLQCIFFWVSQVVLVVENPPASAGDIKDSGLIPGLGICPGEGNGNPLQYSCLGNLVDRRAWWVTV